MDHLPILERMRHPDDDFQKLFPQNNNGVFWLMAIKSTLPWDDSGWYKTKPQFFELVEPHPTIEKAYIIYLKDGQCTLSADSLNNCFTDYPAIYDTALLTTKCVAMATEIAAVAWLQQYRLDDTIIVPDVDGVSWNIHDKIEYSVHGDSSSCIYVKHETLVTLYPHAKDIFEHVQSLGLTSLDVEELLHSATVLKRLTPAPGNTYSTPILPVDITV